jgi:hypothetical protein
MRQPTLGITLATTISIISILICITTDLEIITGWVSVILMSMVPAQIILTLQLRNDLGPRHASLPQPLKGIATTSIMLAIGTIQLVIVKSLTEGFINPPTPYSIMLSITSVVTTLWMVVIFNGIPSQIFKNKLLGSLSTWATSLLLSCVIFSLLFNFSPFKNAPFKSLYLQANGLIPAWDALSLLVTTVSVILALVLLDFHIINKLKTSAAAITAKATTTLIVGFSIWFTATKMAEIDPVLYMVNGPISIIFGEFIILIMLQNSLLKSLNQPFKGFALIALSVTFALSVYTLYEYTAKSLIEGISDGAPFYGVELWIASTMLAVTFPLFVMFAEIFNFWPIVKFRENT